MNNVSLAEVVVEGPSPPTNVDPCSHGGPHQVVSTSRPHFDRMTYFDVTPPFTCRSLHRNAPLCGCHQGGGSTVGSFCRPTRWGRAATSVAPCSPTSVFFMCNKVVGRVQIRAVMADCYCHQTFTCPHCRRANLHFFLLCMLFIAFFLSAVGRFPVLTF